MDVFLPNTEREFADPNYWKKFFERNSAFEWYGDYSKLSGIFGKYIRPADAILQIGCGNSTLADDLHDNGFKNVHSIDTDANVIARQQKRNSTKRPTLKFNVCSAAEIGFISGQSMNVVIDKGTLDALLPHNYNAQDENIVDKMMAEIERCLAPFGRYIVITLAQHHIIEKLFTFFGTSQFMIRLQKCELSEADFVIPVFVVIITKFKTALNQRRKFEYLNSIQSQPEPMENFEKLLEKVRTAQQINWFKHYISRGPVEETSVKIYSVDGAERYELFMVDDQTLKSLHKYGVFIVPLGRENDWLFATPKGRTILRKNCELHRIIVVRLFRHQFYPSLEKIQEELNSIILDFMPKAFHGQRVNYLSLGTTNVTNHVEFGTSKISGDWAVEHVLVNDLVYRRLIFLNSSNLVQTEAEIQHIDGKWQINWDNNPLCCEHHKHMMIAFEFICDSNGKLLGFKKAMKHELRLVVLGLGGGIITKVLHDTFEKSMVVGVELDKTIAEIAVKHFDFPENSERMNVKICDAYKFLDDSASTDDKYDAIFVDLSGPVNEHGLYCPPPNFVTEEALNLMRKSLTNGGVLTLNLVTRDDRLADSVKKQLAEIFNSVYSISGDEDINEVIICSMMPAQKFAANLEAAKKKRKKKAGKKLTPNNAKLTNNNGKGKNDEEETPKWLMDCFAEMDKIHHFSI